MLQVYYAERIASREPVAIKVVVGTDDAKKELRILETISHPNVVYYYGTWEKDSQLWIALEFCHGGAVSDVTQAKARQSPLTRIAVDGEAWKRAELARASLHHLLLVNGIELPTWRAIDTQVHFLHVRSILT